MTQAELDRPDELIAEAHSLPVDQKSVVISFAAFRLCVSLGLCGQERKGVEG
jgi:hypothetical protein